MATRVVGRILRLPKAAGPLGAPPPIASASGAYPYPLAYPRRSVPALRRRSSGLAAPTRPSPLAHPSKFVSGVEERDLERDPAIAAFYAANFPEWESEPDTVDLRRVKEKEKERQLEKESERHQDLGLHPDPEVARLNVRRIYAYVRTKDGTRASAGMRRRKLLPGLLYGTDPTRGIVSVDPSSDVLVKTPWFHVQRELGRYHDLAVHGRVYELTVFPNVGDTWESGAEPLLVERVIPRDIQMDPIKHIAYCTNYLRYHPGRPVDIPIRLINKEESPAFKKGAFVPPVKRTVSCIIEEGAPIPETIDLECTGLKLKQVLRTERLILPDGVRFSHKVDLKMFMVGTVTGGRRDIDDEEEGVGESGEGGTAGEEGG